MCGVGLTPTTNHWERLMEESVPPFPLLESRTLLPSPREWRVQLPPPHLTSTSKTLMAFVQKGSKINPTSSLNPTRSNPKRKEIQKKSLINRIHLTPLLSEVPNQLKTVTTKPCEAWECDGKKGCGNKTVVCYFCHNASRVAGSGVFCGG